MLHAPIPALPSHVNKQVAKRTDTSKQVTSGLMLLCLSLTIVLTRDKKIMCHPQKKKKFCLKKDRSGYVSLQTKLQVLEWFKKKKKNGGLQAKMSCLYIQCLFSATADYSAGDSGCSPWGKCVAIWCHPIFFFVFELAVSE